MTTPTHEQERQAILKEYPLTYFIAAAALFIVLGIAIGAVLFGQNSPLADADNNYLSNVYLTIISTAFTVIVIDRLNRRRDEQRDLRQLQEQLVRDAGSMSSEIAKNAIHQLREREWLEGEAGLLKHANLWGVKLQDVDFHFANLQGVRLGFANLHSANLWKANLQGAILLKTNLQDADLGGANLQSADLTGANLRGAYLIGSNLHGADLLGSILQSAKLADATCDETTTLPDFTKWTLDTDLTRFTDPDHPNFWLSPIIDGAGAAPTAAPPPKP